MKINVNCEIYDLPTTGASKEGQNMFIYKKKTKKNFVSSSTQVKTTLNALL